MEQILSENSNELNSLLNTIEERLIEEIPGLIHASKNSTPIFAIYLWYHIFDTEDPTPLVGIATTEFRDAVLSGKYDEQLGGQPEEALTRPQQTISGEIPGFPIEYFHVLPLQMKLQLVMIFS